MWEALAGRFEAEIMLLHVVTHGEQGLARELQPARQAKLNALLADELKHFTTYRRWVAGDPAFEIVEAARYWKLDLVIMS